jgi:hypothetical protein
VWPLLAAETLHLGDGEPGDADFGERLAHLVELERLHDRFDFLHGGVANPAISGVRAGTRMLTDTANPCQRRAA